MVTSVLFSAREKRPPQTTTGPYVTIQPEWVTQMMAASAAKKQNTDSLHIGESPLPTIEQEETKEKQAPEKVKSVVSGKTDATNAFAQASELNQKIQRAGEKLQTTQEQKVWKALQDLVFVKHMNVIRQLDVHNYLKEHYGKSVDSKLILPLIGNFEKITGRQLKAGYQ